MKKSFALIVFYTFAVHLNPLDARDGLKLAAYLNKFCYECHDSEIQKGNIRLDNLVSLNVDTKVELLNKIEEQVYLNQMPPPEKKQKLSPAVKTSLLSLLSSQYNALKVKSKFQDKLRYPDYGNYVSHEKLFSGEIKAKAYTPARRWLVSPQIFHERVMEIYGIHSSQKENYRAGSFYGVNNPFVLPNNSGVRYYDNGVLNGGHLQVMLSNAEAISKKQIFKAQNQTQKPSHFPNARDRFYPPFGPQIFADIVSKDSPPTKSEMINAVEAQFERVLQREPTETEREQYLNLLKHTVTELGNTEGLRKMLFAVLMKSEFLYRYEFGAGREDVYGRKMLSPRELSYAISYALSDSRPDAALVEAVKKGKLKEKEDVKREVLRLLNDQNTFKGFVDPFLRTRNVKPHISTHPKLIRFFREFFGYIYSHSIFKDIKRSSNFYDNFTRGSFGTSGKLVNEADMLVDYYFQEDKNVFENLLASDHYFVAPIANAQQKIDKLNKVYDFFKDKDWQNQAKEFSVKYEKFLNDKVSRLGGEKQLKQVMTHVETFRKNGVQPHPQWHYTGNLIFGGSITDWAVFYNIEPFKQKYAVKQPFKLPNRKGILMHPAWLIAHSHNFHTDPVKRGRWIREKLLAGRVPDLPITVDAQIPEDHHKTLRERFDSVTQAKACWKCHVQMNPLGNTFEAFDDFGRYRLEEPLENESNIIERSTGRYSFDVFKTKKVDTSGVLKGTGSLALDGKVTNALEMVERLYKSKRVRQSIIRHAFRFFMGRNEMLSDSQTLIDADNAYVRSGGSFKAVVLSLLTSDSFLYRKSLKE